MKERGSGSPAGGGTTDQGETWVSPSLRNAIESEYTGEFPFRKRMGAGRENLVFPSGQRKTYRMREAGRPSEAVCVLEKCVPSQERGAQGASHQFDGGERPIGGENCVFPSYGATPGFL